MKIKSLILAAILLSFVGVAFSGNEASVAVTPTKLPPKIAELQSAICDKGAREAYEITCKQLGNPARDVGSGCRIEQWDIGGGTLTFHQSVGPTFRDASGSITWLIATRNEVKANLHGIFEMHSLHEQDPNKNGAEYWLGNLELLPSGKFEYRDSGQQREDKKIFPRNFFTDHVSGDFDIEYSSTVKPTDALEDIDDEKAICRITFRSGDHSKTFGIVTSQSGRQLRFESANQVFRMNRAWNQYWPDKSKKSESRSRE